MNLLDTLLTSAQNGSLSRAAQSRGIDASSIAGVLQQLVPALSPGIQRNARTEGGLESFRKALASGNHSRYIDDAAALDQDTAVGDGNGILGHLLGSKEVSRDLASRAAEKTGVDVGLIKKFLPIVAAAAMGAMSKQTQGGISLRGQNPGSGLGAMLGGFLDSNGDGSTIDDLLSLGAKFLK